MSVYCCDPNKNIKCAKTECFINGGECRNTTKEKHKLLGILFLDIPLILPTDRSSVLIQAARRIAAELNGYGEDDVPATLEEISVSEELCEHCFCTDYGSEMNARHISAHSSGCEGSYCEEAYEHYLYDFKEERPWKYN